MFNFVTRLGAGVIALAVFAGGALAGEINEIGGPAIKGYDPVAYFTDHKPVKGNPAYTATFDGATFEFASTADRGAFKADPSKYTPQYGGFCAFATAMGHKAEIDPAAFSVVDGKLYLNHSVQLKEKWQSDAPDYIRKADTNWPTVAKQTDVVP